MNKILYANFLFKEIYSIKKNKILKLKFSILIFIIILFVVKCFILPHSLTWILIVKFLNK